MGVQRHPWCVVSAGRSVVYDFDIEDTGMRNLAIVALTDAEPAPWPRSDAIIECITSTLLERPKAPKASRRINIFE